MNDDLSAIAVTLGDLLKERNMMLTTAESCTGGWVGQVITSVAGSSQWYDRGFITYTNAAKQEMLGVSLTTLQNFGAVSEEIVCEMAEGALNSSHGHYSLAISGIAGPGGGSLQKPVGTVCFAWASHHGHTESETTHFLGDRDAVRRQSVAHALNGMLIRVSREDF
jgi:nicotinamide-nucleotide amidase